MRSRDAVGGYSDIKADRGMVAVAPECICSQCIHISADRWNGLSARCSIVVHRATTNKHRQHFPASARGPLSGDVQWKRR